jgi:hypothetical protein
MAEFSLSEFAMEVGKAVSTVAIIGLAWKVAVYVVGIILG